MARLLVVTPGGTIPALSLLPHTLTTCLPNADALAASAGVDAVVLDGRSDLAAAHSTTRLFVAADLGVPVLLVLGEAGFAVVSPDWGCADIVAENAGPAEFDARLRLLLAAQPTGGVIECGPVTVDEDGYRASVGGRPLELTYTEFELLKFLAQHPGRVFSRDQLLTDVWGYDYYGGARTVDVHVRRLRAKLGLEYEGLIGTVRNVGYRFTGGVEASGRPAGR